MKKEWEKARHDKKIGLRKELALEDRADGDEHKNTGELLIEKRFSKRIS